MKRGQYRCPESGCDHVVEFVRFYAEVVATPFGKTLEGMPKTRKGHIRPTAVQREFLVRRPIHGERIHFRGGHHVSTKSAYPPKKKS
jgi:hypothetical protein